MAHMNKAQEEQRAREAMGEVFSFSRLGGTSQSKRGVDAHGEFKRHATALAQA